MERVWDPFAIHQAPQEKERERERESLYFQHTPTNSSNRSHRNNKEKGNSKEKGDSY